jgi:S-methylmethionine-dependent homocysteine/selenocysteine methylase
MGDILFLTSRLAAGGIILLDGATGTELERRGVPMDGNAWSAAAIATAPAVVRAVHSDYIRAGVDVITANSFSLARHMLGPAGLADRFRELNTAAVRLAVEARAETAATPVAIAAAIAPTTFCGTSRHCYPPAELARDWFAEQAETLAEAGAEILCVEMIEDIEFGTIAVEAAVATGLPVWLGFSCRQAPDGTVMLWDRRQSLAAGVAAITPHGGSAACIMHTEVSLAAEALAILKKEWSGPLGVYAHSGLFVMPNWQFNDVITPADYATAAGRWLEMGATIIGGCCGIGPAHIELLRSRFFSQDT